MTGLRLVYVAVAWLCAAALMAGFVLAVTVAVFVLGREALP